MYIDIIEAWLCMQYVYSYTARACAYRKADCFQEFFLFRATFQ